MRIRLYDHGCWWRRLFALPIGALLLTSACGGDGGTSPAAPSVPPAPAPNRAPTPVDTIPEQVVRVGDDPVTLDVAPYFSDPDGDSLTYSATSGDPQVATVSVSASTLTITAAKPGQVDVSVSARDPQGATATQHVSVTVAPAPNRAPTPVDTIPEQVVRVGDDPVTLDVAPYFSDPDGDSLTYSATSGDPQVATVSVSASTLTITAAKPGQVDVSVSARDPQGATATQHVSVTVAPAPNRAPTTSGQIPAQTIPAEALAQGESVRVDVAQYFSDPDGDPLTYEATSSDIEVATVSVSESVVSLTALKPGPAAISVSARDPGGGTATLSFAVTIGGFTVSGTVSDGRNRAPVLSGVPVWVGGSREEATPTGADGRYRLPNLWGTVSVSVAATGYVPRTVEIEVEADRTLDLVLEHTGEPPYGGTVSITPRMIEPSDPTSLGSVTYAGRANRTVFDRRVGSFETVNVFRFEAEYAGRVVDFEVNPEFGSRDAARVEVDRYAAPLGRLPAVLLSRLRDFEIHGGDEAAGGNSAIRHILIHTVAGQQYLLDGVLEEVLMHEGVHASLEDAHQETRGWREAQRDDGAFISEYARDHPQREDFAESFGPWFALRYFPDRLTVEERWAIATTMPNRLAYFDEQGFDMSPYTVRGSALRVRGMSPFQP